MNAVQNPAHRVFYWAGTPEPEKELVKMRFHGIVILVVLPLAEKVPVDHFG